MEHDLKTWPSAFEAVLDGRKRYEIRRADRPFAVGDTLLLREWRPAHEGVCEFELSDKGDMGSPKSCKVCKRRVGDSLPGEYTTRTLRVRVTYLTPEGQFGVPRGFAVLGIELETEDAEEYGCPEPWMEFADGDHCGLCGNTGVIDTRGRVETPAGVPCGVLRFCLCPNGRAWKKGRTNLEALAGRRASSEASSVDWKVRAERAEATIDKIRARLVRYQGDVNLLVLSGEIAAMVTRERVDVGEHLPPEEAAKVNAIYLDIGKRLRHARGALLQPGDRILVGAQPPGSPLETGALYEVRPALASRHAPDCAHGGAFGRDELPCNCGFVSEGS